MKIAAVLILAELLVACAAPAARAQAPSCPSGAFAALDTFGNWTCKRGSDGRTLSTQVPAGQECPLGAHPALDRFGNHVCRTDAAGSRPRTDYYDTSKGCPIGTMQTMDAYGKPICKAF